MCVTGKALLRHQYAQWAKTNVKTKLDDKRPRRQRRSRVSFVISLLLHIIALAAMNLRLPEWYRPPPIPEPIVMTPIELVDVPRFHISSARKRISATTLKTLTPRQPTPNRASPQSRPFSRPSQANRAANSARLSVAEHGRETRFIRYVVFKPFEDGTPVRGIEGCAYRHIDPLTASARG